MITSRLGLVTNDARRPTRERSTTQGAAVRQALVEQDGFRSAQDIYSTLRGAGHKVGLSTVYRHLQTLTEHGIADAIHSPDGETTYRFCGDNSSGHHHHLVCRVCGRAEEVEGRAVERWTTEVAKKHGYVEIDHTVEVFGVCGPCARTQATSTT
jgi:Fur family transcriptional regulator, ferric uptake regulator